MKKFILHYITTAFVLLLLLGAVGAKAQTTGTYPYTNVAGWSTIVSSACPAWTPYLTGTTMGGVIPVNSDGAVVEGAFASTWYNGTGVDAVIITGWHASNYSVSLKLSDGTYTAGKIYSETTGVPITGTFPQYVNCATGSTVQNISISNMYYTPIDFADFAIPAGKGVVGSIVTLGITNGNTDLGRFIITSNASLVCISTTPTFSTTAASNACPTTTATLPTPTNTAPTGTTLKWYTDAALTTEYTTPTAAVAGTYYAAYVNVGCKSPASAAVTVTITNCCNTLAPPTWN